MLCAAGTRSAGAGGAVGFSCNQRMFAADSATGHDIAWLGCCLYTARLVPDQLLLPLGFRKGRP